MTKQYEESKILRQGLNFNYIMIFLEEKKYHAFEYLLSLSNITDNYPVLNLDKDQLNVMKRLYKKYGLVYENENYWKTYDFNSKEWLSTKDIQLCYLMDFEDLRNVEKITCTFKRNELLKTIHNEGALFLKDDVFTKVMEITKMEVDILEDFFDFGDSYYMVRNPVLMGNLNFNYYYLDPYSNYVLPPYFFSLGMVEESRSLTRVLGEGPEEEQNFIKLLTNTCSDCAYLYSIGDHRSKHKHYLVPSWLHKYGLIDFGNELYINSLEDRRRIFGKEYILKNSLLSDPQGWLRVSMLAENEGYNHFAAQCKIYFTSISQYDIVLKMKDAYKTDSAKETQTYIPPFEITHETIYQPYKGNSVIRIRDK